MRVLLLNASFEPLHVISIRRAIGLLVAEKVEVIAVGDGEMRSATTSLPVPAVVRLRYMVRVPFRSHAPLSRRAVMMRDERRCQYSHCRRKAGTIDHVVPRSRGGVHAWDNVVAACAQCNSKKGDRLLHELGWSLTREPEAPAGARVLLTAAGIHRVPPAWADWLPLAS